MIACTCIVGTKHSNIVCHLLTLLQYMHERDIIHRDLKPENLLVMSDADGNLTVKLADFGLSLVGATLLLLNSVVFIRICIVVAALTKIFT